MRHITHRSTSIAAAIIGWGMWAVFAVVVAVVATGCSQPKPAMPTPEVTVAAAIDRQVTDWDEFTGHFEAVESVEVRPRVSGFIQHVSFPEGRDVRRGDVLLTIDPRPYQAEVARADAAARAGEHARAARHRSSSARNISSRPRPFRARSSTPRTSGVAESGAAVRAAEAALDTGAAQPRVDRRARADHRTRRARRDHRRQSRAVRTAVAVAADDDRRRSIRSTSTSTATSRRTSSTCGQARPRRRRRARCRSASTNETGFPHEGKLDFVDNRVDRAAGHDPRPRRAAEPRTALRAGLFARVRLGGQPRAATMSFRTRRSGPTRIASSCSCSRPTTPSSIGRSPSADSSTGCAS